MEQSISPWVEEQKQQDQTLGFSDPMLQSVDYSEQNKQASETLENKVNDLLKQHKQSMDDIYAKKKKKKLRINTSKARGELRILKYLIAKYGWKEVWQYDGDVMWSGLSIPGGEIEICQEIRVNRLPEMAEITSKKTSGYYLNKFREYFPEEYDFFPRTFLIPEELDEYKAFCKKNPNCLYISKPNSGCQGDGIKVFSGYKNLPVSQYQSNDMIVQQYIHKPLLIDKKKFDFRLYVIIVSIDPLVVYVNDEGLVRFCTEDYETPNNQNFRNSYMHLTNYSLNKDSPNFTLPNDNTDILGINTASKRTFTSVLKNLEQMGHDVDQIKEDINQILAKFVVSMNPFVKYNHKTAFKNQPSKCFHVIGFDILLDEDARPWLIEANANPSFNIEHEDHQAKSAKDMVISHLDKYIKGIVVGDSLMLVQKSIEKHNEIGLDGQYRSWKQIVNSSDFTDPQQQIISNMLNIYGKLSGFRFKYCLTISNFRKMANYVQSNLQKVDYELMFKKIINTSNMMDFYEFIQALEHIAVRVYGKEGNIYDKMQQLVSGVIQRI